jgi:hypothetical protein
VRLLEGRIRLAIAGPARDVSYRIDAPSAWVQIADPGEYRIGILRDGDVELAVLRGSAELANEQGRSYIRAGERTFAREGSAPSSPYVFNSAAWDSFDRWSEGRRDQRLGVSAQYLPSDARPYAAAFDSYGSWRNEPEYGYVWYPRVDVGWRPYHRGRWASLRPYGWTWIAADPWGWPTHHYGRWGVSAGSWFWIPGRQWGPAWVSWAYASDYVSWCPLGWNNRPVLQIVNVNYHRGRRYSPWDAWTVVPRRHFGGSHFNVATAASVRIDQRIHNTFVIGDRAPDARFAVGRNATPIRTAGRYAVPRSGSPGTGGIATGRAVAGDRHQGSDRRFPAPARAPRTPSASQGDPAFQGSRSGSDRAVARERSSGVQPNAPTGEASAPSINSAPREYRRGPDAGARRRVDESGAAPVTSAPDGAVRAVPRVRQPDSSSMQPGTRQERTRANPSAPDASAMPSYRSTPPAPRSSGEVDVYRATPRSRSAPDAVPEYRSRSIPRQEGAQAPSERPNPVYRNDAPSRRSDPPPQAPAYRSAPERSRPSGPPPSAAPPQRRSGEDGAGGGGGGRQRSGEGQSSGQGRRRGQ